MNVNCVCDFLNINFDLNVFLDELTQVFWGIFQPRTPKHGLGWARTQAAAGHGRVNLLLSPVHFGGITRMLTVVDLFTRECLAIDVG